MAKKDDKKIQIVDEKYPTSEEPRALAETIARPSPFTFLNKWKKRQLESYSQTIKAGNELLETLETHAKHIDRLEDVETIIEIDRIKRQNELLQEKMNQEGVKYEREKQQKLIADTELEDLEKQAQKLELLEKIEKSKANIRKHQMEARPEEPQVKLTVEEYREKKLRRMEIMAEDSREYVLKLNQEMETLDVQMKLELEKAQLIENSVERQLKEEEIKTVFAQARNEIQKKYNEITK